MWWLQNSLFLFFIVLLAQLTNGQVSVKDPILRQFLCDNYPLAMNAGCAILDTLKAESAYPNPANMRLNNIGIEKADEVLYFKNIDSLYLTNNKIKSFPSDLRQFFPIGRLHLGENLLTEAPSYISFIDPVLGKTGVRLVYLQKNEIANLPAEWNGVNSITQVINLEGNLLTNLTDFSEYKELRRLNVRNNLLDFDDLIPLKNIRSNYLQSLELFPQKEFEVEIEKFNYAFGDILSIDIARGLSTNQYFLIKDDIEIQQNRTGEFNIKFSSEKDFGEYYFKIRNDNFLEDNDFLTSKKYAFQRENNYGNENVEVNETLIFSPNGDGVEDELYLEGKGEVFFYTRSGKELLHGVLPFVWNGKDENGNQLTPGLYFIKQDKKAYKSVLIAF